MSLSLPDPEDDSGPDLYVPVPLVLLNGLWSDELSSRAWYHGPMVAACLGGAVRAEEPGLPRAARRRRWLYREEKSFQFQNAKRSLRT